MTYRIQYRTTGPAGRWHDIPVEADHQHYGAAQVRAAKSRAWHPKYAHRIMEVETGREVIVLDAVERGMLK